jgi:hypothetical protein
MKNIDKEDGAFNSQQLNQVKRWYSKSIESEEICNLWFLSKEKNIQLHRSLNNDLLPLNNEHLDSSIFILDRILKYISTGSIDGELKSSIENLC